MTLRFVKTSILTSEDGIDFSTEKTVESEELKNARLEEEQRAKKPLYQQLAEKRDLKQEEYDANTKKLFAPPKALDADDVEYFDELEANRAKAMEARSQRDEAALESFRQAARDKKNNPGLQDGSSSDGAISSSQPQNSFILNTATTKSDKVAPVPTVIKGKRKSLDKKDDSKTVEKKAKKYAAPTTTTTTTTSAPVGKGAAPALLNMLAVYDSEEDNED